MNLLAVMFNQGSTLIASILVARILMQQSFGEYSMVQNTLLTMVSISQLATGYTAAKYIAEFRSIDPERAGRIMGMCAIVCGVVAGAATLLLVALAPWLATTMLNAPHLTSALVLGAGFLLFSSINGYQTGALSGLEAYVSLAKAGVASGIVAIAAITFGAWWGGLNGAVLGLSMSALFRCITHYTFLRFESRGLGIKAQYFGSLLQEKSIILNFALPAAMAGYCYLPMVWVANTFLVRQPGGYGEMAIYSAANNLRIIVLFLPGVLNSVGLSILNNEKAGGDLAHYRRIFKLSLVNIFLVSLGGAFLVGSIGRPILKLFGKDFGDGQSMMWLLLISSVFEGTSIALYQYIQSKAKIWMALLFINIPRETFLVVSAYWLVQSNAGVGLAASYMGSAILGLILSSSIVLTLWNGET